MKCGLLEYEGRRISAGQLLDEYIDPQLRSKDVGLSEIARDLAGRFMCDFADENGIYATRPFDDEERTYLHFLESDQEHWAPN